MIDLLIEGGTLITMNGKRRVIQIGDIAVDNGIIIDVGPAKEIRGKYKAKQSIDAERYAVMPGLTDTHGHSGHSMMKTIAETYEGWGALIEDIYLRGVKEEFWYVDGLLSSLERLKFGTTTGVSFLGGGRGAYRTDDPKYAELHADAVKEVGIRDIIGLGPVGRAPYTPKEYCTYKDSVKTSKIVDFSDMLRTTEKIVKKFNDFRNLVTARVTVSSISPNLEALSDEDTETVKKQLKEIRRLADETGRGILAHAGGGIIESAHELRLLGPDVVLAHCGGLSEEEINILKQTGTSVSHCPRARSIMRRRCPVVELLDAGVTVALGSDGSAPDRTFDMFADMRIAQTLQRHHFHDASYMPPGKVLEMATIDAAKALGLEKEIGSLEVGKRADIILVNLKKAHLTPNFMIPHRVVYEAYGHDVDTVIVNGKIVMENRTVRTVNEDRVLEQAQKVAEEVVESNDLEKYMTPAEGFWGSSKYL